MKKRAYAYVVLALLTLLLSGGNTLWNAHQIDADDRHWHQALADSQRKFCFVITAFTAVPVAKPADAAANPSREQAFEWYERFLTLGRSLGC